MIEIGVGHMRDRTVIEGMVEALITLDEDQIPLHFCL